MKIFIYCVRYVQNLQIRLEEIGVGPEAGGPQDPGPGPRPGAGKGGHGGKGDGMGRTAGEKGAPQKKRRQPNNKFNRNGGLTGTGLSAKFLLDWEEVRGESRG